MAVRFPDGILDAHTRRASGLPAGFVALTLLGAMLLAALCGLLGGTPSTARSVRSGDAVLTIEHPEILRSGMFFETRVDFVARRSIGDAVIAMSPQLWRSITINSAMPQAKEEDYSGGLFRLHFGPLAAGQRVNLKLDAQINPDLVLGTSGQIAALDGDRILTTIPVETKVLP
jgi:hypothetical protein